MRQQFNLVPLTQKSFGGKAVVEVENGVSTLKSYNTNVATYNHKENKMQVNGYYSPTTLRHINAFFDYYGFDTCTKKELETIYLK